MSKENPTLRLRPEISFSPTKSNRGLQYVVEDRIQNRFWRMGVLEYELCAALQEPGKLSDAIAFAKSTSEVVAAHDVEKVQKTLVWLMQSGLVEVLPDETTTTSDDAPAATATPPKVFDPSSFQVPLLDENAILRLTKPFVGLLSYQVACVVGVIWIVGLVFAFSNASQLTKLSSGLFVSGQQWWLLIAWLLLKVVHEMGHAIACARVGARATGAGIGFMFFAPMPYVNVTNIWRIERRSARILVSGAGMLFEITVAAIAVIGACLIENASVRVLCASIVTMGTISTLMFNGNPLMRFDGYYILIDIIGRPNLWQDAQLALKGLVRKLFYSTDQVSSVTPLLALYGLASFVSRMLMLVTLVWGLWVAWDGAGLIVASVLGSITYVVPRIIRFVYRKPTASESPNPVFSVVRGLSFKKLVRAAFVLATLIGLGFLPSPFQIYWPGSVDYVDPVELRANAPGFVHEVLMHDGQGVRVGDEIIRLKNPDLELEYLSSESLVSQSEGKCVMLRAQRKEAELQTEEANLEALRIKTEILKSQINSLTVRAPRDGVLMIRDSRNLRGMFLNIGAPIGLIVEPSKLEIRASAPQDAWKKLSNAEGKGAEICLSNGEHWHGEVVQVMPRSSDSLEHVSLAGIFGGPLAVVRDESDANEPGYKTESPRLQARLALRPKRNRQGVWGESSAMPIPGLHCSVRMMDQSENVWQTLARWYQAAVKVQFKEPTQQSE